MDKISGIIKSSPRVQSVDIRESMGLRPGTPAFGRTEGLSSLAKPELAKSEMDVQLANQMSAAKRATAVSDELAGWKAKDQMRASIAAELSNKFFSRPSLGAEEVATTAISLPTSLPAIIEDRPSNPSGFKTDSVGSFRAKAELAMPSKSMNFNALPDPGPMAQPEGLFPRGSFIDRIA